MYDAMAIHFLHLEISISGYIQAPTAPQGSKDTLATAAWLA